MASILDEQTHRLAALLDGREFGTAAFGGWQDQVAVPPFASTVAPLGHQLLDLVQHVALTAAGGDVEAAAGISKAQWNRAREAAERPDAPQAESIRQRLGSSPWPFVLRLALAPAEHRARMFAAASRRETVLGVRARGGGHAARRADAVRERADELVREWGLDALDDFDAFYPADDDQLADPVAAGASALLVNDGGGDAGTPEAASDATQATSAAQEPPKRTPEAERRLIARALRSVAYHLGVSPGRQAYAETVADLESERARRGLTPPLGFPAAESILRRYPAWNDALAAAGLDPVESGPPVAEAAPPLIETLDRCITETGILPSRRWLAEWCKVHDVPIGRQDERWLETVERVRAIRAQRGDATPAKITPAPECPPLPDPVAPTEDDASEASAKRRRRKRAMRAEAIESLRIYGREHLPAGQLPRQWHYRAAIKKDARLLQPSVLQQFDRFQDLCREAGL